MAKPNDLRTLIDLTRTTQTLLTHFHSSLAPSSAPTEPQQNAAVSPNTPPPSDTLEIISACTTLLKSHTTTLSLLLLTPPLTPSALITKIGDVSSGALSGLVGAAVSAPAAGQRDTLGSVMRSEVRAQARRVVGAWGEVLGVVLRMAEKHVGAGTKGKWKGKDEGPNESEKQDVLAATGVVWEACDALVKLCTEGVAGLVVRRAEEWRGVLLDAVEELKDWGEDVEDDDEDDGAEGSDKEGDDAFGDEDDVFGAANKLGKGDTALKLLLDASVKKLKMVGMLYQALVKRRLKTFPKPKKGEEAHSDLIAQLDALVALLKAIPETVDDLASAFYDLDEPEARQTLDKACGEAKRAVELVRQSWTGTDDEFTAWSAKWVATLDAA